MEEFKGTPGPWLVHDTYEEYNEEGPQIVVWDGDEQASGPVCDMGLMGDMNYAESLANARLIASAPELLEALKEMTEHLNKIKQYPNDAYFIRNAEKAIYKALGKEVQNG